MMLTVYKHLWNTYGKRWQIWLGFFLEIIRSIIQRIFLVIVAAWITSDIAASNFEKAKFDTLLFLIAFLTGSVIGAAAEYISNKEENYEYLRLSKEYYAKLIGKDISFFRDNQTGVLTTLFRQYLDNSILLMQFFRGEPLACFISLILPPIILYSYSPSIGVLAVLIVVVQFIYVVWNSKKVQEYRVITTAAYRKLNGEVSDQITNIIAFKSGGITDTGLTRVAELSFEENEAFIKRRNIATLLDLPRNIITGFGISLALYIIASKGSTFDPETLGLIILTLTYLFQIIRNIAILPNLIMQHDDLIIKFHPTLSVLNSEHEKVKDPISPVSTEINDGTIEIKNMSFQYDNKNAHHSTIFKNLNINVKNHEQIGIVGLSGAGKSTLANLLLRFDDVTSGSISIDGIDIRTIKQDELRKKIAYVPQEPLLFHRSIKENIQYFSPDTSHEDVIHAAKAAHAHEFIEKLPHGYDTLVGERGIKLSGGQKQRIAIARAILKKAPIMIFDEATSALDSESEQVIQRSLPKILGKQTAIIIAHRLSTIANLDRIIVMHAGKIIESGTHAELLDLKGQYYSLWQKQTRESTLS